MLPVWRDDSKSPAMIKHCLDVIHDDVSYLNPGQKTVVAFDQPLYAITKRFQYHFPNKYE